MGVLERFREAIRRSRFVTARRDLLVLAAIFAASRAAGFAAGVRFDARDLAGFWHFAPVHLLEGRLVETIVHLHFQPPLFNLYLGCILKIFGSWSTPAFGASFFLLGLATALGLLSLMRRLGVGRRVALVATAVFTASPAAILFENYLFYELPVAALLVFSALALHAAVESGRARAWALFFALLATLVLTRASFHPVVLLGAALAAFVALAGQRRAIVRGFLVPALLVLTVCLKNAALFGSFGTSSWLGMGLARMTLRNIDPEQKAQWVREGLVSPVAAVHPPSPLDAYAAVTRLPEPTGVPVLDEPRKPDGDLNLHHLAYAHVSRALLADGWAALKREPGVYFATVRQALARFFRPASTWHPLVRNRGRLASLDRAYNAIVHFGERGGPMIVLFAGALLGALAGARRRDLTSGQRATLVFAFAGMAWVLLTGTLLEPLENMRFRFAVEPFVWTVVGLFVTRVRRRRVTVSR